MEPDMGRIWRQCKEERRLKNVKEYSNRFFKNLNKHKYNHKHK